MNKKLSRAATVAAVAASTVAMAACTTVTSGTPVVEDIAARYTGPQVVTSTPVSTDVLSPGVEVSVGVGKNAVTCTAGWIARANDNGESNAVIVLAGHCARQGAGAPVSMTYRGKPMEIGRVTDTSFSEPYSHDKADLAVAVVSPTKENKSMPFAPFPALKIPVRPNPIEDGKSFAKEAKGLEVCWLSSVKAASTDSYVEHCGTVEVGNAGKVLVKADKDAYSPIEAGAPVYVGTTSGREVPVGVVTDYYKGHVVVDTIGTLLTKANMSVVVAY